MVEGPLHCQWSTVLVPGTKFLKPDGLNHVRADGLIS